MKNQWRTLCVFCKRRVIIQSKKLLPHPNRNGVGRCKGSGAPHPKEAPPQ